MSNSTDVYSEMLSSLGAPIGIEEIERIIPDTAKQRIAESLEAERMEFIDSYGRGPYGAAKILRTNPSPPTPPSPPPPRGRGKLTRK